MTDNNNAGAPAPGQHGASGAKRHPPDPADAAGHAAAVRSLASPSAQNGSGRLGPWVVLELLMHRWHWLVIGFCVFATGFYLLASWLVHPKFIATGKLLRYEAPGKSDAFKTTPISGNTFAGLILSPELLQRVGGLIVPPIAPEQLVKQIKVDPDPDTDLVKVDVAAAEPKRAVELLNLFLTNAVSYTRELDARQAALLANDYLKIQVTQMDRDITAVQHQLLGLPVAGQVTNKLARVGGQLQRLNKAVGELDDLLAVYTDKAPKVQAKREEIKELETQLAHEPNGTNLSAVALMPPASGLAGGGLQGPPGMANPELDIVNIKLRALEDGRLELLKRAREAELYAEDPPGSVRIFATGDLKTVKNNLRALKIGLGTIFGGLLGLGSSLLLMVFVEFIDNRLKTADDVVRVTKLPVLTSLGNLHAMSAEEREQWAFRTWTMLQGRLSPSPNYGLVCGITSSAAGEGRSTWISLLAQAASLSGFKVLTIATRPSPSYVNAPDEISEDMLADADWREPEQGNGTQALTHSVLTSPNQITEQLSGPNPHPIVHIPLPGWVWNLERRKQWRDALEHWRGIDNLVIFVELPPASVPEAVLLGSNLPNMVWLSDSGAAQAGPTRTQIETLRHARCNLVGAVLNHEPSVPLRKRFPRWVPCLFLTLFALLGPWCLQAQEPTAVTPQAASPAPESAAGSFSIINPAQRAPWQKHLTLGPGDVLTFALYDHPELTQAEVPVGPDGRINFLEATNVVASGLTVDQLRVKLDQDLSQYRRAPHTMIMPVAYHSKKYYMLGKVRTKGVYVLDQPLTVLEALARAHGLESALVDGNVVGLTDFSRSFLARRGKRIPLDFERLFERGDLSQNIAIQPGDYIYFAPGDVSQVYVVGEVRLPGVVAYRDDLTIIGAIAARGGYTQRAFKARVLVVRGSLSHPQGIAVNTHAILDAKEPNFKLRPGDIIYVNSRPFIKVEELADEAAQAFIQSVVTSWVGVDVLKPF